MKLALAAVAGFSSVLAQNSTAATNTVVTWTSTSFISEEYSNTRTVLYGSSPVTPVPTITANITILRTTITELTASRNINRTTWVNWVTTLPLETVPTTVWATGPRTVTSNETATETTWVTPTLATVTFSPITCTNGAAPPNSTVTRYTGDYTPMPGQATGATTTIWPTAVTSYPRVTVSYRLFVYTGSTVTYTSTATGTTWLSTTTTGTTTYYNFRYTRTSYLSTTTQTNSDWQLAFATNPVSSACDPAAPATVTLAARCAPTNLIREMGGRGVGVRVLPREWVFPLSRGPFGSGVDDASRCCQACVDNAGCAASEWTGQAWRGTCMLFYHNGSGGKDTCANGTKTELEFYGDAHLFPGQGSAIQSGCGRYKYRGAMDPFCPDCRVEEVP